MKQTLALLSILILSSCSSNKPTNEADHSKSQPEKEQVISRKAESEETESKEQAAPVTFQTSTYDDPEFADQVSEHRVSLKALSDNGVFSTIHTKLFQKLAQKHRTYFKSKANYELLALAKGKLFPENKTDGGFIVYDKKHERISILVYREKTNKYAELFRDLKVENGLENAGCNYSSFGTIDYQLAEEIIYQEESLTKNPESYLESSPIKITDIAKNEDFLLKEGCFSKKVPKKETSNSLAIATSCVYNNWEALRYSEANNSLVIYYGQAFAD